MSSFTIDLCSIGECGSCLYSWCCPPCAIASARSHLDGSEWCFNFFCMPATPLRFLIRSSYSIGDTTSPSFCTQASCNDCMITNFCYCCSVNQMLQTVKSKGPASPTAGYTFNRTPFSPTTKICEGMSCCSAFLNIIYTVCCPCCKVGTILENSVGMPWCMGCCCMPLFAARNIIRYQYRISPVIQNSCCQCWPQSNECIEECVWPTLLYYLGQAFGAATFGAINVFIWAYEIGVILSLEKEVSLRKDQSQPAYLIGFNN